MEKHKQHKKAQATEAIIAATWPGSEHIMTDTSEQEVNLSLAIWAN